MNENHYPTHKGRFTKKPVTIDAYKLPAADDFHDWCVEVGFRDFLRDHVGGLYIRTLEGEMHAGPGDWIIKGVKGEFYPCKPDIFEATYEVADPAMRAAQPETAAVAGPIPLEGWREQFKKAVYSNLAAADVQDVPLEEYPERILSVLDSVVGPRHPTVVHWRNDAIQACIAIAYKYCRDPESFQYLKQDLQALITAAPTTQAAPQPVASQEPAAWLYDFECDGDVIRDWLTSSYDEASSPTNGCHNIRPLYLALATQPQETAPSQDAEIVLAALDSGEWDVRRCLPIPAFTEEANCRNAWAVTRIEPPYSTKDGMYRLWWGATAVEALQQGSEALGVELPIPYAPQPQEAAPLTNTHVQQVPDQCDRIVWRNKYYHLPFVAAPSQAAVAIEREACAALAGSQWTNDVERLYGRMVAAMIRART